LTAKLLDATIEASRLIKDRIAITARDYYVILPSTRQSMALEAIMLDPDFAVQEFPHGMV
jgi:hypothetical protein